LLGFLTNRSLVDLTPVDQLMALSLKKEKQAYDCNGVGSSTPATIRNNIDTLGGIAEYQSDKADSS
jgi:hypothetical protein